MLIAIAIFYVFLAEFMVFRHKVIGEYDYFTYCNRQFIVSKYGIVCIKV